MKSGETPGDRIQAVGYVVYKARLANRDAQRGKSGGYRIIYYLKQRDDVLLVTIYSKTEQSDVDGRTLTRIIQDETDGA